MLASRTCTLAVVLASLAGCLGEATTPTESSDAGVNIGGTWLVPLALETSAWAGDSWIRASVEGEKGPGHVQINPDQTISVFPTLYLRGTRWAYDAPAGKLELSASTATWKDPVQSLQQTTLGLIAYHRPAGSQNWWMPLRCGTYGGDAQKRAPANAQEMTVFNDAVTIDTSTRTVGFRVDGTTTAASIAFDTCGITEPASEFAAMVLPVDATWDYNLYGTYDYTLVAKCNGAACPAFSGGARADEQSWGEAHVPWIGVSWELVWPERDGLDLEVYQGVLVDKVTPGGPADRAGVRARDVLLTLDGKMIHPLELTETIQAAGVGHVARFEVLRRNTDHSVDRLNIDVPIEMKPDRL